MRKAQAAARPKMRMSAALLLMLAASGEGLLMLPGCVIGRGLCGMQRPSANRAAPCLAAADGDNAEFEEVDAMDTSDSWSAQEAEFAAWQAAQKKESSAESVLGSGTGVDEDAHYDLGGEDEEDPAARTLRQLSEKQAALMLSTIEAKTTPTADKAILTSLEAVISTLNRLTDQVDRLSAKVDALQAATASAPPQTAPTTAADASEGAKPTVSSTDAATSVPKLADAAPTKDEWDGEVDETAWFDEDDDDDMPDWRDVRRLNKLL